ncbi:hypothetical protein LVJ94_29245 [Pendulispora rubella]|uniref:Uncharacterized protein n=1 Tax=Pendulispora rubella TaxID=2741070 RepID=A0ABZ2KQR7_9BACT
MNALDHEGIFAQAWNDPRYTRYEIPPLDVNRVLEERYRTNEPLRLTRTMLWDMETKKSRRPDRYIPYVVAAGSAEAWDDRPAADGAPTFVRKSMQRLWRQPDVYELILEQTRLNHATQTVTFIGAASYPDRNGQLLHAGTGQPIFHVVHGVGGEEDRPHNRWEIVLLTDARDAKWTEPFAQIARDPWLPGYLEIYIRNDLGIDLTRRDLP